MATADLLLHPVRLRIVQAFLGDRPLTMSQLADELDDVSTGSLRRHVAVLTKAGVLQVVSEHRVGAVVQRTYMLRAHAAQIGPRDVAAMTPEQHAQAFMAFAAGLLADFDRYVKAGKPDLVRDRVGYRVAALWLTDDELDAFLRDLVAVIQPRLANPPGGERRRRLVAGVTLPAPGSQAGPRKLSAS